MNIWRARAPGRASALRLIRGENTAKTGAATARAQALILGLMYRENALAMQTAFETGLRIGDVLSLRTKQINQKTFTVTEQKTGKKRKIKLSEALRGELATIAGREYVFTHRLDPTKHRTRQAVWKDIKRVQGVLEHEGYIPKTDIERHGKNNKCPVFGTHTGRKTFARRYYDNTGDFDGLREKLNHGRDEITAFYIMSALIDIKTSRKKPTRKSS